MRNMQNPGSTLCVNMITSLSCIYQYRKSSNLKMRVEPTPRTSCISAIMRQRTEPNRIVIQWNCRKGTSCDSMQARMHRTEPYALILHSSVDTQLLVCKACLAPDSYKEGQRMSRCKRCLLIILINA
jgi:hypothetical protein